MERVGNLGGAAPGQFKEKRIEGVIGGISANLGLMKLDGAGLLVTGGEAIA